MKLQQVGDAGLCWVLLVASEMAVSSGCDILQLVPCNMAASENAQGMPSKQCCSNVAKLMGEGADCLCSLLTKSLGAVPPIALGIPHKCRIPLPKGLVCQGISFSGS